MTIASSQETLLYIRESNIVTLNPKWRNRIISILLQKEENQHMKVGKSALSSPMPLLCLSYELPGIKPRSIAVLPTTLTNKPNTWVKDVYVKPFCSADWWTCISQWSKFYFLVFLLSKPKGSIYSVSDLHDQQIVWWKTQNLELCFGTNMETNQAKMIEKILISWAMQLGFLCSLVTAILCADNKSNQQREERPIGTRAVKLCIWEVRVLLHKHNRSIWCQGSSSTTRRMMAHSKTQPVSRDQTYQNSTRGGGNLDSSARFLAFHWPIQVHLPDASVLSELLYYFRWPAGP